MTSGIPEIIRESIQEGCPEHDDKETNWFTEWLDLFIKIAAAPVNSCDVNFPQDLAGMLKADGDTRLVETQEARRTISHEGPVVSRVDQFEEA